MTAWLWLIPVLVVVGLIRIKVAAGPYWLGNNLDPAYTYLLNGLSLAQGKPTAFLDHPGVPLQLLIAAVVRLLNLGHSSQAMVGAVLDAPEFFLQATSCILMALLVVGVLLLGGFIYRKTGDVVRAMLVQIPALALLTLRSWGLEGNLVFCVPVNVNSDTLMIAVSLALAGMVFAVYADPGREERLSTAVLLAVIVGIGMATKLTFLPWAVAPFFLLRRGKLWLVYVGGALLCWGILMVPAYANREMFFLFFRSLTSASGGSSLVGQARQFAQILSFRPEGIAALVLFAGAVVLRVIGGEAVSTETSRSFRYALMVLALVLAQYAMVARRPGSQYLVPAVCLLGLAAVFVDVMLRARNPRNRQVVVVLLAVVIALYAAQAWGYAGALAKKNNRMGAFSQHVRHDYPDCTVVAYYRSSSPEYALFFGDNVYGEDAYKDQCRARFPEAVFYRYYWRVFRGFGKNVFFRTLTERKPCVLLYGETAFGDEQFFRLKKLESAEGESIYRVEATTLDAAHVLEMYAAQLKDQGRYGEALLLAYRARALGCPDLDGDIRELEAKLGRR